MKTAHDIAWDKAFDGITPLRRKLLEGEITEAIKAEREVCAEIAADHAEFCIREARNGGHDSLFERAKGAYHIATKIREKNTTAGEEG